MKQEAVKEILQTIPQNSLIHVITYKGDKICIKDNSKTSASVTSVDVRDLYIEVKNIKNVNGQSSTAYIYIDFEDVARIEATHSLRSD